MHKQLWFWSFTNISWWYEFILFLDDFSGEGSFLAKVIKSNKLQTIYSNDGRSSSENSVTESEIAKASVLCDSDVEVIPQPEKNESKSGKSNNISQPNNVTRPNVKVKKIVLVYLDCFVYCCYYILL